MGATFLLSGDELALMNVTDFGKQLIGAADQAAAQIIIGAGGGSSLPSNAAGALVNNGSGTLSWTQSPVFVSPTVNTQSANDNSTKVASTAYADRAAANAAAALVNSAPGSLDTLKELADAINDDASYAATITTALGTKETSAHAASTYVALANNLSDLPNKALARANLSLAGAALLNIGTTTGTVAAGDDSRIVAALSTTAAAAAYQPLDAELTALAGLTSAADRIPYFTGAGAAATFAAASYMRGLLANPSQLALAQAMGITELLNPLSFGNCVLWLDPFDLATLSFRNCVYFDGTKQQYLYRPGGAAEHDFAGSTHLSINMWVYFNETPADATFAGQQRLLAKMNQAISDGTFWFGLAGSGNNVKLEFGAVNSTPTLKIGQTSAFSATLTSPGKKHMLTVAYNGGGGSDDNQKLTFYIDNTLLTTASSAGNIPASLRGMSGGYGTGNTFWTMLNTLVGTSGFNNAMRYEDVAVWDGVTLTANDVADLWNNGAGVDVAAIADLPHAHTDLRTPTMYWILNEESGQRNDISGGAFHFNQQSSTDGSPIKSKIHVKSWTDKSGICAPFYAALGTQKKRAMEPEYLPNGPNKLLRGVPCIAMNNNQAMWSATAGWMGSNVTGMFMQNVGYTIGAGVTETFDLATSDDTTSNERLLMGGLATAAGSGAVSPSFELRIQYDTGATHHGTAVGTVRSGVNIAGNSYPNTGTLSDGNYVAGDFVSREIACVDGTSFASTTSPYPYGPWRITIDAVDQTPFAGDGGSGYLVNGWITLMPTSTGVGLNQYWSNAYNFGASGGQGIVYFGDTVAHAPVLPGYYRAAEMAWLQRRRTPKVLPSYDSNGLLARPKDQTLIGTSTNEATGGYVMTNATAQVAINSTNVAVSLDSGRPYRVRGQFVLLFNGATYSGGQTLQIKLRRTNNTAADLPGATLNITLPAMTTNTQSLSVFFESELYVPGASNDTIAAFANVSATPSAGDVRIVESRLRAEVQN